MRSYFFNVRTADFSFPGFCFYNARNIHCAFALFFYGWTCDGLQSKDPKFASEILVTVIICWFELKEESSWTKLWGKAITSSDLLPYETCFLLHWKLLSQTFKKLQLKNIMMKYWFYLWVLIKSLFRAYLVARPQF